MTDTEKREAIAWIMGLHTALMATLAKAASLRHLMITSARSTCWPSATALHDAISAAISANTAVLEALASPGTADPELDPIPTCRCRVCAALDGDVPSPDGCRVTGVGLKREDATATPRRVMRMEAIAWARKNGVRGVNLYTFMVNGTGAQEALYAWSEVAARAVLRFESSPSTTWSLLQSRLVDLDQVD